MYSFLFTHVLSQILSFMVSVYVLQEHKAIHFCTSKNIFLYVLMNLYICTFIVGFLPYVAKKTGTYIILPTVETVETNSSVLSCEHSCVYSSNFCQSNILLLKKRVFFLALFQAIFIPIFIQLVEHQFYICSFFILIFLFIFLFFLLFNLLQLKNDSTSMYCLVFVLATSLIICYILFFAFNICTISFS